MKIATKNMKPNIQQPRRYFNEDKLRELGKSLKKRQLRALWVVSATKEDIPDKVKATLDDVDYLIIDGERRWRASQMADVDELNCQIIDDMTYVDVYSAQIQEDAFNEGHSEVAKARGILQNFFDRLEDLEGFQQFREGRDDLEAVVALVVHFYNVKNNPTIKSKIIPHMRNNFQQELKKAETANNKTTHWIRKDARNILKIDIELEKEVVDGGIALGTATEIARLPDKKDREKVVEYAKKEGLTKSKAAKAVSVVKDKEVSDDIKNDLLSSKITPDDAKREAKLQKWEAEHPNIVEEEPEPLPEIEDLIDSINQHLLEAIWVFYEIKKGLGDEDFWQYVTKIGKMNFEGSLKTLKGFLNSTEASETVMDKGEEEK